jgi:hypothetical protein
LFLTGRGVGQAFGIGHIRGPISHIAFEKQKHSGEFLVPPVVESAGIVFQKVVVTNSMSIGRDTGSELKASQMV